MSNPYQGRVEIDIGGATRLLRYDMNALAELEQALDKPLHSIFDEQTMGVHVLRATLWAGLKWQSRKITASVVGGWMEPKKLAYYGEKVAEALNLAMGVEEKEAAAEDDADDSPLELEIDEG